MTEAKFSLVPIGCGARKGAKQWQEDSYASFSSPNNKVVVGGIWDGHGGYNGMLASRAARDYTLHYLGENKSECEAWTPQEWESRLQLMFAGAHDCIRNRLVEETKDAKINMQRTVDEKGIVRSPNGDPIHGGTTASMVVCIRPGTPEGKLTIVTANCGDSTGLLIRMEGKTEFLTVDHGPERPEEFKRLMDLPSDQFPTKLLFVYDKAGTYRKYDCPRVFNSDGTLDRKYADNPWAHGLHPTNVRYEPAVYAVTPREITKDSTCIAMTRALGDLYAHQFGLTPIPSITTKELDLSGDYCLVVGSDGIWDCWKYGDFSNFVKLKIQQSKLKMIEVAEEVLDESIRRAVTNFGARHYDDASFVCWRICPGGLSELELEKSNN